MYTKLLKFNAAHRVSHAFAIFQIIFIFKEILIETRILIAPRAFMLCRDGNTIVFMI